MKAGRKLITLVSNGTVDIRGNVADKQTTGGWKASPFIIAVNMVSYFVGETHQSLPDSATDVTNWIRAAYVLTLLGAFLTDAYLGCYKTIIFLIYLCFGNGNANSLSFF